MKEERYRAVAIAHRAAQRGLALGTSGNLSMRVDGGFLVSATGTSLETLTAEELSLVKNDDSVEGTYQPSSEWRFHRDIYRARPDVHGIFHVHSRHATTLACLHRSLPAFHYMVAIAGGRSVRCAPYATYGTPELSANVLSALEGRRACLLANHGLVTAGASIEVAFDVALEIEHLAGIYLDACAIAEPAVLADEEMDLVLAKFAEYRKTQRL
jgi:L-fuculose-phosphate aldolase